MIEPVGPLSPKVYWIRRVAVIVVAVLILVGLVWFVLGRGGSAPATTAAVVPSSGPSLTGELATPASSASASSVTTASSGTDAATTGADTAGSTTSGSTTSAAATEVPASDTAAQTSVDTAAQAAADAAAAAQASAAAEASAAAAAQAAADAKAAADAQAAAEAQAAAAAQAAADAARPRDAEGRLICPDTSVKLTATVGSPTYNVGQQPIVGVTVVNVGTEPCVRDVSGSLQEYLAYDAAGNRIWSTSDCLPGTGTDVRFLQPGESVQYNIKWSGTTSQPGCAAERTRVPAGEYRIEVRIGSLVSSQAALTFR